MKLFNKIIIAVMAVTCFISCDDFTEFDRDFILSENGSIETTEDLQRFLLGAYNSIGSYNGIISINSLGADEVRIGQGNRGQGLQAHSFTLTNGSGEPLGIWNSAYDAIDNANRVLRAIDDVTTSPGSEISTTQIMGEALALRAWQYFDLLRMFAPSFDPSSPGVPLVTSVQEVGVDDLNIPRSSVGEVLQQINEDLTMAADLLSGSNLNVNRFNINAVRALQARVAIYSGGNDNLTNAVNLTTQILTEVPLVSGNDYINMFRVDQDIPTTPTETIFQIERDQFDGRIGTIFSDVNQDVFFSTSVDLFNQLSLAGQDRFNTNIDNETEITERIADGDDQIVGKYLGSTELLSLNNIKVFRSSEMLLIRAEANALLGNLSDARNDIDQLRTTRGSNITTPANYTNLDQAIDEILNERRVELAFEGHRLLDLKRYNRAINRIDDDCSGVDRPATSCNLEAGSFRFTFPIPQAEIFANDGISDADQNPGY
ncbi:RagB/SusD family nutrient uptake outer membrane protein [uncultured Dokdonia sp.]|uniref:RagB/SusD family nutrient uptake outer membrane protein n=1 Tax=uncultured Dokdonia sp. TaxID=575653 RepID=UPI00263836ED|nr:RagB/SusD family nutrient uptake outer membrane protein [uncultured Dokdonia sp.]